MRLADAGNEERLIECVLANPVSRAILERAPDLELAEWWLTGGAVFQTVWNVLDGRNPRAGIIDYDLFYFDATDLSYAAEDRVVRSAERLFADVDAPVEIRNEARVHLWYERHFGVPGAAFTSCRDAIDHFVSTTCCFGVTADRDREMRVYAPWGFDDLFAKRIRPNPRRPMQTVYEAKTARWRAEWSDLVIDPWPAT